MVRCSNCGTKNKPEANYCNHCGSELGKNSSGGTEVWKDEDDGKTGTKVWGPNENDKEFLYGPTNEKNAQKKQKRWSQKIGKPMNWQNSIGMKFKLIPPGEFMMGSEEDDDSKPVHNVKITEPFYIGFYPVTQREWKTVMSNIPSHFKEIKKEGWFKKETHHYPRAHNPVEQISWEESQEFIQKLNLKEGVKRYRLPTEAEWECACRAGSNKKYCFGDDKSRLGEYAWYEKNSGSKTHPVGKKKPNQFGLYDVHRKIFEWVQDRYDGDYYYRSPKEDPSGPSDGSRRVSRGGSWCRHASDCTSAYRRSNSSDFQSFTLGFRLVKEI